MVTPAIPAGPRRGAEAVRERNEQHKATEEKKKESGHACRHDEAAVIPDCAEQIRVQRVPLAVLVATARGREAHGGVR